MNPSLCFPDWIHHSHAFLAAITDLNGEFVYVNEHFQRRYADLDKNLIGLHYQETVHPEDLPKCLEASLECQLRPQAIIRIQIRTPSNRQGKYEWNDWEFSFFADEDGQPQGIFRIGYDITQLKESLSALLSKNLRLREIAQQQAHEVRSPLSSIMGLVDLMSGEQDEQKALAYLPYLKKASEDLDHIIHSIIALTYDPVINPDPEP